MLVDRASSDALVTLLEYLRPRTLKERGKPGRAHIVSTTS